MATIATVSGNSVGEVEITKTALTGTDDFLVKNGIKQILVLENTGSGTPTINLDGDQATTAGCAGVGNIDISAGLDVALTATGSAGAFKLVNLSSVYKYLNDADNMPAVTGGTSDVLAYIIEG